MGTRWPLQDSQQERAVGRHQACKREQLEVINPEGERAVRGDQASRGRKLGANRLAGEQLDINQAGMEWLGCDQAGRQKQFRAIRKAGRQAVRASSPG